MTSHHRPLPARRLAGLASAVALALALVLGLVPGPGGAPAGAHDGDAVIVVEATHPAGMQIHYIVRVTWADDGHPADGATVTATALGADGTQVTPVTLTQADSDGRYSGALEYPSAGSWTLRITAIEPTGKIEQAQEVTPLPATTAPDPSNEVTTSPGDGGETGDEGGFAPADDGTGDTGEDADAAAPAADAGGDDDSGMPMYLVVAAAAVVIIAAVTAVNLIRRNRAGAADDDAEAGTGPSGNGDDALAPGGNGATSGAGDDAPAAPEGAGASSDVAPTPGP